MDDLMMFSSPDSHRCSPYSINSPRSPVLNTKKPRGSPHNSLGEIQETSLSSSSSFQVQNERVWQAHGGLAHRMVDLMKLSSPDSQSSSPCSINSSRSPVLETTKPRGEIQEKSLNSSGSFEIQNEHKWQARDGLSRSMDDFMMFPSPDPHSFSPYSINSPRSSVLNTKKKRSSSHERSSGEDQAKSWCSRRSFEIQNERPWHARGGLSRSICELMMFSSTDSHSFSSYSINSPRSPVLNTKKPRVSPHDCLGEIQETSLVQNIATFQENKKTVLLTNLESTDYQPENEEPGWKCVSSNIETTPDQHNTRLLNKHAISHALGASFSSLDQESIFTRSNISNDFPKNKFSKLVEKNSEVNHCPVPQVTKKPLSDEDEKHSYHSISHAENHVVIPVLPAGLMGNTQKLVTREEESKMKPNSNVLKQKSGFKSSLMPQFNEVTHNNDVVVGPPHKDPSVDVGLVNDLRETDSTIELFESGSSDDESDESGLEICLSSDSESEMLDRRVRILAKIKGLNQSIDLVSRDSNQSSDIQLVVGNNYCTGEMSKSTMSEDKVGEGDNNVINMAFARKHPHSPDNSVSSSNVEQFHETTLIEDISNGGTATDSTESDISVPNYYVERNFEELCSTHSTSKTLTNQLADTDLLVDPKSTISAVKDCNVAKFASLITGIHAPDSGPIVKRVLFDDHLYKKNCNKAVPHEVNNEASGTRTLEAKSVDLTKKERVLLDEHLYETNCSRAEPHEVNNEASGVQTLEAKSVDLTKKLSSKQLVCSEGTLKTSSNPGQTVRFNFESLNEDKHVSSLECDQRLRGVSRTNDFQSITHLSDPQPDECHTGIDSTESVIQNPSETEIISDSPTKCELPFDKRDEKSAKHVKKCKTIAYALVLRSKQSAMFQSLPIGSVALELVNQIIGNCVCKQFLLGNLCATEQCSLSHNVELNFDIPGHDLKTSFNTFSTWYFSHSTQPNFKTLLHLMSFLSRDFGDDLLITILCFSPALMQVAQNFRRPLGIKLIEKLVHTVNFTKEDAIRTILIFILTPNTSEAVITELLSSLGVDEKEMENLYDCVSCIWHINPCYSFSPNVFFSMLKECLQEMPSDFKVTKEKLIEELLKYPRNLLRKNFHVIDRILLKYFALNSFAAHKVRSLVFYGKISEPEEDSTKIKSYQSSRVKSTGPINYNWQYLDCNEEREKSVQLNLGKILQEHEDEEEVVDSPIGLSSVANFKMEELLDEVTIGHCLNLLPQVDTSEVMSRIRRALLNHNYKRFCRIILESMKVKKSLETVMSELHNILLDLGNELPRTVYKCLTLMPKPDFFDSSSYTSMRYKFIASINAVVLTYYKERDFKRAMKVLKTMRTRGVNPLRFLPEGVSPEAYAIACSEIHLECLSLTEAVDILIFGDCLKSTTFNLKNEATGHYSSLERIVLKLLKLLKKKRLPGLAMNLFRAVVIEQESLFFPIRIDYYYEFVLSYSLVRHKACCASIDVANMYVLIERLCSRGFVLRPTTLRSLVVELVRSKAPDDTLRRILFSCINSKIYPPYTPGSITLKSNLLLEEMCLYLRHCFQFLIAQGRSAFLQRPFGVHLVKSPNPVKKKYPFLEEMKTVSTQIFSATKRFEEAMTRVFGSIPMIYISRGEIVIPTEGLEAIADTLVKARE